jgi:hypothetical protein
MTNDNKNFCFTFLKLKLGQLSAPLKGERISTTIWYIQDPLFDDRHKKLAQADDATILRIFLTKKLPEMVVA